MIVGTGVIRPSLRVNGTSSNCENVLLYVVRIVFSSVNIPCDYDGWVDIIGGHGEHHEQVTIIRGAAAAGGAAQARASRWLTSQV